MSDLQDKFTVLQAQLSGQHVEIGTALDSILVALGAPPSTPATNLTDIAELMAAQHTALLEVLGQVNTNLDTMINNNSLNAQRLLIAIAANDPCRDCATTPIAPPPLDVTPQTVDQEHCKRMQALIYALRRFTVKLDVLSSFGLGFSPTVINDAISEVITELGVSGQLVYPSLGEVAQLAGAGAAYIVSNIFSETSLPAEFLSIEDSLLLVLYDTDNAADGQAAYRALLAGSTLDSKVQLLFSAMAYTSIFNLYYNRTIELDLSGYDGTICAPDTGCFNFSSSYIEVSKTGDPTFQDVPRQSIIWGEGWTALDYDTYDFTFTAAVILQGDYHNWRVKTTSGVCRLVIYTSSTYFGVGITSSDYTIGEATIAIYFDDYQINAAYAIEFCEPE